MLVEFKAKNHHPQQFRHQGRDDSVDDRALPTDDFQVLHKRFEFTVDAAASDANAKLPRYWTIEDNGLSQSWAGESVYCNPPFSEIGRWVDKAWAEQADATRIVMLLPANRTEQDWWQDDIEDFRDREWSPLKVEFLRGRTRFLKPGKTGIGPNERPPFGCCLCIWEPNGWERQTHGRLF